MLEYRKAFIERSIDKLARASGGSQAPSHFVTTDMGNEFSNLKIRASGTPNTARQVSSGVTKNFVNACADGTAWIQSDGSLGQNTIPFRNFLGFLGSKGIPEFAGGVSGPLNMALATSIGTSAITQMNPIKTHASVLTTLLELIRGDVPGLLNQLRKHFTTINLLKHGSASGVTQAGSAIGAAYLENVFAWTPIFKDINAAIQVLATIDGLMFPEDNTRRTFERVLWTHYGMREGANSRLTGAGLFAPLGGFAAGKPGLNSVVGQTLINTSTLNNIPVLYTARETVDVRCTARFNTSLVPNATNNGYLDQLNDLLGLKLTPQVIWDLTPWSWLIDWFANIGSVMENLGSLHMSNIILNYAYATFRCEAASGAWQRPVINSTMKALSGNFITQYGIDHKVRLKASPYGFGTALGSLNANQWAVLVALGLARAR
jgi:hypothetical protein